MFNTYRDPTGCYGDLNVESFPQNVDETNKTGPTAGPGLSAWNLHAPESQAHTTSHNSQSGNTTHSSAPSHYHSAFHHHAGSAAMDTYGYSLAQVPHKDTEITPGKELMRSSSPPPAVAAASWQSNRSRARYSAAVTGGAFLPYQTQLNHFDGPPLEAGHHNVSHGGHGIHSHPLSRKQPWPGENSFAGVSAAGQYQREPASLVYGENIRGNVSGGIIRHTTSVSGMEARNSPIQQHQSAPQHIHSQQQPLLHHQQQHPVPHHDLFSQLVQKEREARRLPGYQDPVRHSVVRSRIGSYPETFLTQPQQFCNPQDVLRKSSLPVPVDGDRRSAFTARQAPSFNPSNWNKNSVPFLPFHHPQMLPSSYRAAGSAFQPCNKAGESEIYPPDSMWSKSGQIDHGNHIQVPGHPSWMHNPQSQMFLSRPMQKQSLINNSASVLGLDTGQMEAHSVMQTSAVRQVSASSNISKGHSVPVAYQQQHLNLQSTHLRNHMMHPQQVPPQPTLRQQSMMSQHQPSPMSNSTHSSMVTSPSGSNQSPQITNACSLPPPQQHVQLLQQQQGDSQLVTEEASTKENLGTRRSLRNCQDVREFLENWDEDDDVGTPRPCVDGEAGDNADQPLDTTELVVLDCSNLQRDEAANLITMYSGVNLNSVATVTAPDNLLTCASEGLFSSSAENVAQGDLQNLLETCGTSSGSSSTTIATPVTSPTGQSSARTLDMLLNSALPTPPASQEQNIVQTNVPQSTPVTVVGFSSPALSQIGESCLPKIDSGFGPLSPTSPAASLKFTNTTVNTPFVRFPPTDDPPSVIQSSKDHLSFSTSQQYCTSKEANIIMSTTPEAVGTVGERLTLINSLNTPRSDITRVQCAADSEISASPALSDTDSKLAASHEAYKKRKHHSSNHGNDIHTSLDSNLYGAHSHVQGATKSSRSPSTTASEDVDRSKWAFAQISEHARFSSHGSSRILKTTRNYEVTEFPGLHQPSSNSDHPMIGRGTAPLNCGLESQKSDNSKFDKSTSPTVFLTSKDTQTEETRKRRVDPYLLNDTFAQTSVRCIQDEIHHDTFAQTSVCCLQDEIHNDSYAQTSVQCLQDEVQNCTVEKNETSTQVENLSVLHETCLSNIPQEAHIQHHSEVIQTSSTEVDCNLGTDDGGAHVNRPVYKSDGNALDLRTDASHREAASNPDNYSTTNRQSVGCISDNGAPEKVGIRTETSSADVSMESRLKSSSPDVKSKSTSLTADSSILSNNLYSSEQDDTHEVLRNDNKDQSKVPCRQEEPISIKKSEGRNRSVGIGTEDKYLSRIVDLSPGNIPKILLSRLKESSTKQNGVIKRLPSIRLTRISSPMSSCGSDIEYVCSVSDANVGTSSSLDENETDINDDADKFDLATSPNKKDFKKSDAEMLSSTIDKQLIESLQCEKDLRPEITGHALKESSHENLDLGPSELAVDPASQLNKVKNTASENMLSNDCTHEVPETLSDPLKSNVGQDEKNDSPMGQDKSPMEILPAMTPEIATEVTSVQEIIQASVNDCNAADVLQVPVSTLNAFEEKVFEIDKTGTQEEVLTSSEKGDLMLNLQVLQEKTTCESDKRSPDTRSPQMKISIIDDESEPPSPVSCADDEEHIFRPPEKALNCKVAPQAVPDLEKGIFSCDGNEFVQDKFLPEDATTDSVEELKNQGQELSEPISSESGKSSVGLPVSSNDVEEPERPLGNLTKYPTQETCSSKTSDAADFDESKELESLNSSGMNITSQRRDSQNSEFAQQNVVSLLSTIEDLPAEVRVIAASVECVAQEEDCLPNQNHFKSPEKISTTKIHSSELRESFMECTSQGSESKSIIFSALPDIQELPKSDENLFKHVSVEDLRQSTNVDALENIDSSNMQSETLPSLSESESDQKNPQCDALQPNCCQSQHICGQSLSCTNHSSEGGNMPTLALDKVPAVVQLEPPKSESHTNFDLLTPNTVELKQDQEAGPDCLKPSSCDINSGNFLRSDICDDENFPNQKNDEGESVPLPLDSDILDRFETRDPESDLAPKPAHSNSEYHQGSQSLELAELSSLSEDESNSSIGSCPSSPHSSVSSLDISEKDFSYSNFVDRESHDECTSELKAMTPVLSSELSDKANSDSLDSGTNHSSEGESMPSLAVDEVHPAAQLDCPELHGNSDLQSVETAELKQDKTSEVNSSSISCMQLCLDDIPLPGETYHVPNLDEYQSKQIGIQVEEDVELTTADKDTQSSEDSFTLSDEERAFPNPQRPNFDVTRIPLPDEAAVIKTRILKARNKKRHAESDKVEEIKPKLEKFCDKHLSSSYDSIQTSSKFDFTGPTSVATQCSRSVPPKRQFGFMSRSSQTHKIKINLRPRKQDMSPIYCHDSQTLMEVVEEVSKVLHEDGDQISVLQKGDDNRVTSSVSLHSEKNLQTYIKDLSTDHCSQKSDTCTLGGEEIVCIPSERASSDKEIDKNVSSIRSVDCRENQICKSQEIILECDRSGNSQSQVLKMKSGQVTPLKLELEEKTCPSVSQESETNLFNSVLAATGISKSPVDPKLTSPEVLLNKDRDEIPALDTCNTIQKDSNKFSEDESLLHVSNEPGFEPPESSADNTCHEEMSKNKACAHEASCEGDINQSTSCQTSREDGPAAAPEERKKSSSSNDSTDFIAHEKSVPNVNDSAEVNKKAGGDLICLAPGDAPESVVTGPALLLPHVALPAVSMSHLNLSNEADAHGKGDVLPESFVVEEGSACVKGSDAPFPEGDSSLSTLELNSENLSGRNNPEMFTTDCIVESDKHTNYNLTDETEFFGDNLDSVGDSHGNISNRDTQTSCDIQERVNVPLVPNVQDKISPHENENQCGDHCEDKATCTFGNDITNNLSSISEETNILHVPDQLEISQSKTVENQPEIEPKTVSNFVDHLSKSTVETNDQCGDLQKKSRGPDSRSNPTDEVHVAVGKNVYKLSSEWQTIYFEDVEDENNGSNAHGQGPLEKQLTAQEISPKPDLPGPLGPEQGGALARQSSSEDDLPPLDAPGLEAAQVAAESDSDLEMPCLQPEAQGLAEGAEPSNRVTASEFVVSETPTSTAPRKEMTLKRPSLSESSDSDSDSSGAGCRWKRRRTASCASCASTSSDSDSASDSDDEDDDGALEQQPRGSPRHPGEAVDAGGEAAETAASEAVEAAVSMVLQLEAAEAEAVEAAVVEVVEAVILGAVELEASMSKADTADAELAEMATVSEEEGAEAGGEDTVLSQKEASAVNGADAAVSEGEARAPEARVVEAAASEEEAMGVPDEQPATPEASQLEAVAEEQGGRVVESGGVEASSVADAMPATLDVEAVPDEEVDAEGADVMQVVEADTMELGFEAEAVETVIFGAEQACAVDEAMTVVGEEVRETGGFDAEAEAVKSEATELTETESTEAVADMGGLEISDIRTVEGDLAEWNISGGEVVPVPVDSIYNWPYVEEVLTSELADGSDDMLEAHEDDVEIPDDAAEDEEGADDKQRPRLRCSLSWNRFLQAGEGLVLGPAKIEFRISGRGRAGRSPSSEGAEAPEGAEGADDPEQAAHGARRRECGADGGPWNVVDRDRSAESAASAHSYREENNNHLLAGLAGAISPGPVIKVNKLILKRPGSPLSSPSPLCSNEQDDNPHWDSPDGSLSLKTKGALKSYQLESACQSRGRGRPCRPCRPGPRLSRGSRPRRSRSRSRTRSRTGRLNSSSSPSRARGRRSWYSQLSPVSSTASWRSPGAVSDGEVPKVIIKRGSLAEAREARDAGLRPMKALSLSLGGPAGLAAALDDWRMQPFVLVARDPKLDARALRQARREQRELRARHREARRGDRGHKHDRERHQDRRRARDRQRSHSLQMLAEVAEGWGEASYETEPELEAKRRKVYLSPERQSQKGLHVEELVRRWRQDATPSGQDTPMPPSPCEEPLPGLSPMHLAEFASPEGPEPEASHWSRLLEAPSPYMSVSGEGPPEGEDGDAPFQQAFQCEACGKELSGEATAERANHIKQHPYHCQRCYKAFASQGDFLQHLQVDHPNSRQLHHCLLCLQTFSTKTEHAEHLKGWSHCHMERSQRRTIHTLFRMFTGSDCPRLAQLSPEDMQALDWLPNDSGVIHFYHQATPLQLATEDWHLHHGSISGQPAKTDSPPPPTPD